MSQQFFITGSGTDIGKSFYLQKVFEKYRAENRKIQALKPIISGFDIDDLNNDSALILKSLALSNNSENLDKISPWRFASAVSPNIAAKLENKEIDLKEVINFCQKNIDLAKKSNCDLFIEGAGGIMTPINNNQTFLDLMKALKIPVILVVGDYLGCISHSLSAIKALEAENIKIAKIAFNQSNYNNHYQKNLENLRNFTSLKIELI